MADLERLQDGTPRVNVGYGRLIIDKLYGPLIFAQLEVEAVPETCEWVIRRDGVEFCRIAGQLPSDFDQGAGCG